MRFVVGVLLGLTVSVGAEETPPKAPPQMKEAARRLIEAKVLPTFVLKNEKGENKLPLSSLGKTSGVVFAHRWKVIRLTEEEMKREKRRVPWAYRGNGVAICPVTHVGIRVAISSSDCLDFHTSGDDIYYFVVYRNKEFGDLAYFYLPSKSVTLNKGFALFDLSATDTADWETLFGSVKKFPQSDIGTVPPTALSATAFGYQSLNGALGASYREQKCKLSRTVPRMRRGTTPKKFQAEGFATAESWEKTHFFLDDCPITQSMGGSFIVLREKEKQLRVAQNLFSNFSFEDEVITKIGVLWRGASFKPKKNSEYIGNDANRPLKLDGNSRKMLFGYGPVLDQLAPKDLMKINIRRPE